MIDTKIDFGRQPSRDTLVTLYNDDKPIGYFASQTYSCNLESCETTDDYARAIVNYAIDLHKAQADYSDISPYGGLDIDVEPVDKIVLREVQSATSLSSNVKRAAVQALIDKRIDLRFCKETIETFETMRRNASGDLSNAFKSWLHAGEKLQEEINSAVEELNNKGDTMYNKAMSDETEFKNKSWFYKISHNKEYKEIQSRKNEALSMVGTTVNSLAITNEFGSRINEHLNSAPNVKLFSSIEVDYECIDNEDALNKAVDEAQKYCSDPRNIEVYNIAKDAVQTAEIYQRRTGVLRNDDLER